MEINGIFAGLGNPGREYAGTRHNTGFIALQYFLSELERGGARIEELNGAKFKALLWRIRLNSGDEWLAAEPQTFMNLSGAAIQPIMAWYKIPAQRLIVLHDELDLPPGRMKLQKGGSPAGHNGLKSIQQMLGTTDFYRLRIGIGHPQDRENVIPWVLGHFSPEEKEIFTSEVLPHAAEALQACMELGPDLAMNTANRKKRG